MFLLIKDSEIDEEDEDDDKKNVSSQLRSSPQYSRQKRWKKNYCNGYAGIYSAGNMISTFTAVFHYESRWDFMKAFSVPYKFS